MRRRSRTSSKLANARSRKAKTLKAVRHSSSSADRQDTEVARLRRELDDAREQQTATAEVLKIISTSPTELRPVLELVVRSAARFCEADDVSIFELDGQDMRMAAHWGSVPHLEILEIGFRFPCTRGSVAGRTVLDRKPVHVIDLQAEAEDFPEGSALARRLGHRTTAGVPLLREGVSIGTLQLRRTEANSFTDKQMMLLGTFADQAVIAIENARLLSELRQRTDQIAKLNQQLEQRVADQVGEIERMSRLRRFLPPQVADLIIASGTEKQLKSHRREITALFCDLRGFTGFSESSDPEDVMALLREYQRLWGRSSLGTAARLKDLLAMVSWLSSTILSQPKIRRCKPF
jgi:transcriptional regulator with GAF, ATPase, and Fis domain